MTSLVFLPNWVGDAVMCTPALRWLHAHRPDEPRIAVCRPAVADTLAGLPWLDDVIRFNPRSKQRVERSGAVLRQLRATRPHRAILFPNSWRSAWLAWRSGAAERIGLARNGRSLLLTRAVPAPSRRQPHPALDDYQRIALAAEPGAGEPFDRSLQLVLTADEQAAWRGLVALCPALAVSPSIVLNTGGAFGPAKSWPIESFATLARRLAQATEAQILIACGPAERIAAIAIEAGAAHERVISLHRTPLSIGLTKAVVAKSRLLVTTDSGPRHFAAAFGVPEITLFGPTHQAWSQTDYALHTPLQLAVECGPCQQRACPRGHHRCLRDLSVDVVFRAALRAWHANAPASRSHPTAA